ncbi:hypothetical protein J6G99_04900 [bacterium]|nr:hypothetical protein [bacterium]
MEIKNEMKKPYTENDKLNFIVKQNHILGYEIKETENSLQAWGKTENEILTEKKEIQIREIKEQLNEIDLKSIRPARAGETERLAELENQAVELRNQLAELKKTIE